PCPRAPAPASAISTYNTTGATTRKSTAWSTVTGTNLADHRTGRAGRIRIAATFVPCRATSNAHRAAPPEVRVTRRTPLLLCLLSAVGTVAALVVVASPAAAAACAGAVRFSGAAHPVYVSSGTQTPSSILALCPGVPLVQVDPANRIWQLN